MLSSTTSAQHPALSWLRGAQLQWSSAWRAAVLGAWDSACRHAERKDRVVPYY